MCRRAVTCYLSRYECQYATFNDLSTDEHLRSPISRIPLPRLVESHQTHTTMSAHWDYFEYLLSHYQHQLSNLKDLDARLADDLHKYRRSKRVEIDETALDCKRQQLQANIAALTSSTDNTRRLSQGMISAQELVGLDLLHNRATELYAEACRRPELERSSLRGRLCDEECCVVS